MNDPIAIPFSSTLKMVTNHNNWVDFWTKDCETPVAFWDVGRTRLGIYSNPYKEFNDVKTLADVARCFGAI